MIVELPDRPAVLKREELGRGVMSLHLEHAAGRHRGASHSLFCISTSADENGPELIVLRVLHESMEPKQRLLCALREEQRPRG